MQRYRIEIVKDYFAITIKELSYQENISPSEKQSISYIEPEEMDFISKIQSKYNNKVVDYIGPPDRLFYEITLRFENAIEVKEALKSIKEMGNAKSTLIDNPINAKIIAKEKNEREIKKPSLSISTLSSSTITMARKSNLTHTSKNKIDKPDNKNVKQRISIEEDKYYKEIQRNIYNALLDPDAKKEEKDLLKKSQNIYKLIIDSYQNNKILNEEIVDVLFAYNNFVYTHLNATYISHNIDNSEKKLVQLESHDELKFWVKSFINKIQHISNHESIVLDFSGIFGRDSYDEMLSNRTPTEAIVEVVKYLNMGLYSLLNRYDVIFDSQLSDSEKNINFLSLIRDPACGLNSSKSYATTAGSIFSGRASASTVPEYIRHWLNDKTEIPIGGIFGHKSGRDLTVREQLQLCENDEARMNTFLLMNLHNIIELDKEVKSAINEKKIKISNKISKLTKIERDGIRAEIISLIQGLLRKHLDEINESFKGVMSGQFIRNFIETKQFDNMINDLGENILMWYSPSSSSPSSSEENPANPLSTVDATMQKEAEGSINKEKNPDSKEFKSSSASITSILKAKSTQVNKSLSHDAQSNISNTNKSNQDNKPSSLKNKEQSVPSSQSASSSSQNIPTPNYMKATESSSRKQKKHIPFSPRR